MVLLNIQREISHKKIDNLLNKTSGAAKICHLGMER